MASMRTTAAAGAKAERKAIQAAISRMIRDVREQSTDYVSAEQALLRLYDWIRARSKRYRARKGGLPQRG